MRRRPGNNTANNTANNTSAKAAEHPDWDRAIDRLHRIFAHLDAKDAKRKRLTKKGQT